MSCMWVVFVFFVYLVVFFGLVEFGGKFMLKKNNDGIYLFVLVFVNVSIELIVDFNNFFFIVVVSSIFMEVFGVNF